MLSQYNTPLDIDSLHDVYTSEAQIKESFDKITAPTGRYMFTASKIEKVKGNADHPFESLRDRGYVHVFGKMTEKADDGTEKRRGSVGFDASWEVKRSDKGAMDRPAKLWGQVARALGMEKEAADAIINGIEHYPLSVYVTERFKTPEGWRTAYNAELRSGFRKAGYEARNYVDSVSRA